MTLIPLSDTKSDMKIVKKSAYLGNQDEEAVKKVKKKSAMEASSSKDVNDNKISSFGFLNFKNQEKS